MNLNLNHLDSPSYQVFSLDDDFDKKINTYFDNLDSPDLGLVKKRQYPLNISPECHEKEFQTTQFKCTSSLFDGSTATNLVKDNFSKPNENIVKNPNFSEFNRDGEKRFICGEPNCGMTFKFNCELKRHLNSHLKIEKFECSICNKSFNRKDNLTSHLKTHDGKEFICPICNEGFNKKWSLQNHMKKHEDNDSIVCEFLKCTKKIPNSEKEIAKHYMYYHMVQPPTLKKDKFKNCEEINNLNSVKNDLSKKTKADDILKDIKDLNDKGFGDELRKKKKTEEISFETLFNFESKYG